MTYGATLRERGAYVQGDEVGDPAKAAVVRPGE
jgi:hypothetical protein